MAGPLHYIPFMQREWLSSAEVQGLSLAGQGLLFKIICLQWENDVLLESKLARLVGGDRKEFNRAWKEVSNLLVSVGEGIAFPAYLPVKEQAIAKVEINRANSLKGGRPRGSGAKEKEPITEPSENRTVLITEPNTESESYKKEHTPLLSSAGETPQGERVQIDPERFEEFFKRFREAYPQRKGNYGWPKAKELLLEALATREATAGEIMDGTKRFRAFMDSDKNKGTEFVPMASTWVEDHGWADEYPTVLSVVSGGKPATEEEISDLMRRAGIR